MERARGPAIRLRAGPPRAHRARLGCAGAPAVRGGHRVGSRHRVPGRLRALLPDEIPVLYEMPGKDTGGGRPPRVRERDPRGGRVRLLARTELGPGSWRRSSRTRSCSRDSCATIPRRRAGRRALRRTRRPTGSWSSRTTSGPSVRPATCCGRWGSRSPSRRMGRTACGGSRRSGRTSCGSTLSGPRPRAPPPSAQLCERAKGHVPCLAYAGHGEGWLKRAGPVFRCRLFRATGSTRGRSSTTPSGFGARISTR